MARKSPTVPPTPLPPLFSAKMKGETQKEFYQRIDTITRWFAEEHRNLLVAAGMPTTEIDHMLRIKDPAVRAVALFEVKNQLISLFEQEANYTGIPVTRDAFGTMEPKRFNNSVIINTDLERGSQIPGQLDKWGHSGDNFEFLSHYYYTKWINDIKRHKYGISGYGGDGVFILVPESHAVTNATLLAMVISIKADIIAKIWHKMGIQTSEGKPHWTRIGLHGGEGTFVDMGNIMNSRSPEIPMGLRFELEFQAELQRRAPFLAAQHASDIPFSGIHFVGQPMNQATRLQSFGKREVQGKPDARNIEESNIWMVKALWEQLSDELKDYFPRVAKGVAISDVSNRTDVHALRHGTRFDLEKLMKKCAKEQRRAAGRR